ncbi:TetR/AcrR family transcriptional regulator [Gracilibacillus caseinilyticus]|uniref:TetR/AcrR family transcriptional regulator n=1 Tax=Gracilibacillus caseinilyticus TaxID=2932256 RepID=A0ABY4F017_9BACI|nr:TetR/AcrR family transcriptional regulator [Gracilibacillus caseinilyticus]UOQ49834.1 TetR/AcrR family transcriptional regulator [Gracilibacillus caseinilyticus]
MEKETLSVPSGRKDANRNERKIMESAKAIFKEKGTEAKIEEIAEKAGVGVGTVYRRFLNKERLVWAVGIEIIEEIREKQQFDLNLSIPADQKMRLILDEFLLLHQKYGKLHEMLVTLSQETKFGDEISNVLTDVLQVTIKEGQEQGIFRKEQPEILEIFILYIINPNLIKRLRSQMDVKDIPKTIADFVLKGLSYKA